MIEQNLPEFRGQVRFGVKQKRGDVILQRAPSAALVVHEERPAIAQHDVSRLKIAIEEVVALGAQQKFRKAVKIVLERLLVKRNACEPQEIVFEVVQIPGDGLAIEAGD